MVSQAEPESGNEAKAPAGRSFLAGCLIALVVILGAFVVLLIRGRAAERKRVARTHAAFAAMASRILAKDAAPEARGVGSDFTGQEALRNAKIALPTDFVKEGFVVDGWDNPISYRRGKNEGFRLHSCGPNGRDEDGSFDDLVYQQGKD